jgi:hypothetical protein
MRVAFYNLGCKVNSYELMAIEFIFKQNNFDIVDFFPSIKYKDVFKIFYYVGYNKQVSHLLTKLCVNEFNILPQGAPTSPAISNIVLLKLDKRLSSLSDCFRCSYTRYAVFCKYFLEKVASKNGES